MDAKAPASDAMAAKVVKKRIAKLTCEPDTCLCSLLWYVRWWKERKMGCTCGLCRREGRCAYEWAGDVEVGPRPVAGQRASHYRP